MGGGKNNGQAAYEPDSHIVQNERPSARRSEGIAINQLKAFIDKVISLDITTLLAIASLAVATLAMKTGRAAFSFTLREQWIEKIRHELESCLPTNNISQAAGLRIARLVDSMPKPLVSQRREIIQHGFYRALPGGGFDTFWNHLCEIQGWHDK